MTAFSNKMQELKRIIRLHSQWLVYATLGESALTKSEVTELEKYGKLPMGKPLDLVDKSYLLGRLRAILKREEYKDTSYEGALDEPLKLTPLEELVVEQARLRAGQSLKGVAQDIADGTYTSLSQVLGKAVSEALVSQSIADETALALIYKKTAQQLASDLASRLHTGQKKNWSAVAKTALHAAKVAGSAQAIVNKLGVYAYSAGPESQVSVIPGKACCKDCEAMYTGPDGQSRIFRLASLMGAGSNADGDVTHGKVAGKHTGWKTTLPPLHPSCGCQLEYVPPGHGWVNGKLTMLNKSLFMETLQKARAGVSSTEMSATVSPKGAPSNKAAEPGPASQPGAAAPGNVAGPGRPAGGLPKPGSGTPGGSGGGPQYVACPFGGGTECSKHGGNGAAMHKPGGAIMKAHAEAMMHGAKPTTPEAIEAQHKQMDATAIVYNQAPHPRDVTLTHLSEDEIGSAKDLSSDGTAGLHKTNKATIVGNGSGAMKPPPKFSEEVLGGGGVADGASTMPVNMGHRSEAGAYKLAVSYGLEDHVPPTVIRSHDGSHGMGTGEHSIQQWKEGHMPVSFGTTKTKMAVDTPKTASGSESSHTRNHYAALTQAANISGGEPAAKSMQDKLHEIAVLDITMNNNDRHFGNIVLSPDRKDVTAIDHGFSFGSGMQGHKNGIHLSMDQANRPLTVPNHLHNQFKNRSLGDSERALEGSGLRPWQVMQTHIREKYVAHLQDTHSYVPLEATRSVLTSCSGEDAGISFAMGHGWGSRLQSGSPGAISERYNSFKKAEAENQAPDQLFASFAKDYITKGLADKSSPQHADFEKMAKEMPAHKPGEAWKDDYAGSEDHKKYWDSIPAYNGVKCESFEVRYNRKQPEQEKPLRTPPNILATRAPAVHREEKTMKPHEKRAVERKAAQEALYAAGRDDFDAKYPAVKKGLWLDSNSAFPLTVKDLE